MGLRDAILLGVLGVALAAAPVVAAPQVVTLGGDTTGDNDPVAACGALASSPWEAGWEGRGLKDKQIFLNGAQAACEAARKAAPGSAEVKAWLARVYVLIGRRTEAEPMLRDAADAGNALAAYELARLLADPNTGDPGQAMVLLRQAAKAGYVPALNDLAARYQAGGGGGDPGYADLVRACIKPGVIYSASGSSSDGNPTAVFRVQLLPTGEQAGAPRLVRSSGSPAFDRAVETGIRRCDPFPRPSSGRYESNIEVQYRMFD